MSMDPVRMNAIAALLDTADMYEDKGFAWHKDKKMSEMYLNDSWDLRAIAECLKVYQDDKAKVKTANLDTAVRDEIPFEAWVFVGLSPIHPYRKVR